MFPGIDNCTIDPLVIVYLNVTQNITLCFDDVIQIYYDNNLTGSYIVGNETYNDRLYYYQQVSMAITYYIFYDEVKRYWRINDKL